MSGLTLNVMTVNREIQFVRGVFSVNKYVYVEMCLSEVREIAKENRVVLQPVGMIEDHGPHLPLITDILISSEICRLAAELIPRDVVLMPPLWHGYSPHHMDFPGPITIKGTTLLEYTLDVTRSLIHHGFRRILIVNGHGSNTLWMEAVARLTVVEHPEVLCASLNWWSIPEVIEAVKKLRTSSKGGTSHAGELETSMMLAIRPELVNMEKAVKDISYPTSEYFPFHDLYDSSVVKMMEWWSTQTETGVMGDATVATKEKGKAWLEAAVEGLIGIVKDFRRRKIRARVDHHH